MSPLLAFGIGVVFGIALIVFGAIGTALLLSIDARRYVDEREGRDECGK